MDRVRFGRALGIGTREAARALARATDAALAPDPQAPPPPRTSSTAARVPSRQNIRQGTRRFQQGVFQPLARASSVLWFEFTGSFFALFAIAMAIETWKYRAQLRPSTILSSHAWLAPALFLVFAWFTVSSFLNARRRSRR